MNPKISSKAKILQMIVQSQGITAKQIRTTLEISEQTLFKHLASLVASEEIQKIGKPPKVFYIPQIEQKQDKLSSIDLEHKISQIINENYLRITPQGNVLEGVEGFANWCQSQNLDIFKTAKEYSTTLQKYDHYKHNGFIDASFKLTESFEGNTSLKKLLYLDFYAIERFGKTKLAILTFQAKQSQDKKMIASIVGMTKSKILRIIDQLKIEAVGFIPPTVDRKIQFQTAFKTGLDLKLPHLNLIKLIIDTPVQQKSLKSKQERIINANSTIYIDDARSFKNILLIDDFIGSGATMNQTAKKILHKKLAKNVYGLALTGSFKGFEVINMV
jgi:phosphoribosylpyrophosphate synthetase